MVIKLLSLFIVILDSGSSSLYPASAGIIDVIHSARFIWCWGSNVGLCAHQASTLPPVLPQLGRDQTLRAWEAAEQETPGWTPRLSRVCVCDARTWIWFGLILFCDFHLLYLPISPPPLSLFSLIKTLVTVNGTGCARLVPLLGNPLNWELFKWGIFTRNLLNVY